MSTTSVSVLRRGREKAKCSPWRGQASVAMIAPEHAGSCLSMDFVQFCLDRLSEQGYRQFVTGALSPLERAGFVAAGFEVAEDLRLLSLDLTAGLPPVPNGSLLRRVGYRRRGDVLDVDAASFPEFWHFDVAALADALTATPTARFRASYGRRGSFLRPGTATGYAICGQSGTRGYVQRLAVHPEAQGQGLGRRLLLDGLHWMKRCGALTASVNTQTGNAAALALYAAVGFRDEPFGLSVLSFPVAADLAGAGRAGPADVL